MVDITRRGFLTKTSLTVGAVGVGLASGNALRQMVAPGGKAPKATTDALASVASASSAAPVRVSLTEMALPESMIVHVRDASTGEISVMLGTQEVVVRDQELVARLVQVAGPTTAAEG